MPGASANAGKLISVAGTVLFLAATWDLARVAAGTPPTGSALARVGLTPNPNAWPVAAGYLLLGLMSVVIGTRGWRPHRSSKAQTIGLLMFITIVFGAATFWQKVSADGYHNWILYITWIMDLFLGVFPDFSGTVTPPYNSLPFQTAVLTGILTTTAAVVLLVLRSLQGQRERRWVLHARDIDVITSVDNDSLDLARALIRERSNRQPYPFWHSTTVADRMRFWRDRRRSGVVVIAPTAADPLVGEFRTAGCRVLVSELGTDDELRHLLLSRRHATVHRLFVTSGKQASNIDLAERASAVLDGCEQSAFVPRIIMRVDDLRDARAARLDFLSAEGHLVDAICADELVAREIIAHMERFAARRMVLLGHGALFTALLHELTIRRAFCHEISVASCGEQPEHLIGSVTIVDPTASRQARHWSREASPASLVPAKLALEVHDTDDWEGVCDQIFAPDEAAGIVIAHSLLSRPSMTALRLASDHPQCLVFAPDSRSSGVTEPRSSWRTAPGCRLFTYGSTILEHGQSPEDSWSVLARQNHETHLANLQRNALQFGQPTSRSAARRSWGRVGQADADSRRKLTPSTTPTEDRLPEFFREDNLLQVRSVLSSLRQAMGPGASQQDEGAGTLSADQTPTWDDSLLIERLFSTDLLDDVSAREHDRWCQLRLARGWRAPRSTDPAFEGEQQRLWREWHRCHPSLWDWETGHYLAGSDLPPMSSEELAAARASDIVQVGKILLRLLRFGVLPLTSDPEEILGEVYVRVGEVEAYPLTQDTEWSPKGDQPLRSRQGDWWVIDGHGQQRGVSDSMFHALYHPKEGSSDRFLRRGCVRAFRANGRGTIETLEGTATYDSGDWIVSQGAHHSWTVPDEYFRASYRGTGQSDGC